MAAQLNDTVGIYPQQYEEKKMEERIQAILKERFGRDLDNCTKSEIFEALMVITKQEMAGRKRNTGSKKLYYISAEFLIGKLLSNNLINLGMYEEVEKALAAHGRELTEIEEMEMEPSLGTEVSAVWQHASLILSQRLACRETVSALIITSVCSASFWSTTNRKK